MEDNVVNIKEVLAERGKNYGDFSDHAALAQALKFLMFSNDTGDAEGNSKFNDVQLEAIEMICHKLARIGNGDPNYKDSWVDIAGYATLVAERLK